MSIHKTFTSDLLAWHQVSGRKNLPWKDEALVWSREQRAYYTLVSEVMLQQTQAQRVKEYFPLFIKKFPDIYLLSQAREADVLKQWQGLGYYRRAIHLHQAAQTICQQYLGKIPKDIKQLVQLPGIGQSTGHAILAQSDNQPLPIVDANVIRVFCRLYAILLPTTKSATKHTIWSLSTQHTPQQCANIYTQSIMDFGALVCKPKALCQQCFAQRYCLAVKNELVAQIPQRKKSTKKRLRLVYALITDGQSVVMLKRGSNNIWPKMWSLPEFLSFRDMNVQLNNWQIPNSWVQRYRVPWVLTHRILSMHCFVFRTTCIQENKKSNQCLAVPISQLAQLALPAPFISMLQRYGTWQENENDIDNKR